MTIGSMSERPDAKSLILEMRLGSPLGEAEHLAGRAMGQAMARRADQWLRQLKIRLGWRSLMKCTCGKVYHQPGWAVRHFNKFDSKEHEPL